MKLYQPFVSKAKNKKYSVYVKNNNKIQLIHFGDKQYGQFRDKIGNYKNNDNNDPKRHKAYYDRHGRSNDKNSARYWAQRILW